MGRPYTSIEKYLKRGDVVVEIGGERGEGSTHYFADLAKKIGIEFHSVDIDPKVYEENLGGVISHVTDGVSFLGSFDKKIKFAYLDNYDWIFTNDPNVDFIKNRYKSFGGEHSNMNSMNTHLAQAMLIDEKSYKECFILFDDTWKINGKYDGKGGLAVPYLLSKGYKIIHDATEGEDRTSYVLLEK